MSIFHYIRRFIPEPSGPVISRLPHYLRRALFIVKYNSKFRVMQNMRKYSSGEYTYKSFDDTRSIFIHIPKAAGVSVCKSLYGNLAGEHCPVSRYQYIFSKKDFYSYFKFTFVRNPWDRLFSAYTFLKSGGFDKNDKNWAAKNLSQFNSFEQFVTKWLTLENIQTYTHFVPQTDLLFLPGSSVIPIDFIGFFENIEHDFTLVAEQVNKKATLKYLNKTSRQEKCRYIDNYSKRMIDIVEKVYHVDIKTLGYSFDNSTLDQQLTRRSKGSFYKLVT